MPEFIGPIAIPDPGVSGTFPVPLDYSSVSVREPRVVVHQFGTLDAKIEQRFYEGPGVRTFQVQLTRLTSARRTALVEFFESRRGSYQPFTLNVAEPNGSDSSFTARFAQPSLQLEASADGSWRGAVELFEVPTATPSYEIAATETRFPGSGLKAALLSQAQEVIPLVQVNAGLDDFYLSDRRVSVGGHLYQPRLMSWGGISQGINGEADQASFTFGNGDRVFSALVNQVDLFKAEVAFSVFHVGTRTRLDLWKGFIGSWSFDGGPEFRVEAHDGLYALRLGYPARKIARQDDDPRRAFDIPNQPVNVGGKKGISRITSVSVANDTAYGRALKDIWVNSSTALPVECDVIAGRDESEYFAALGVAGRGPINGYGSGHTLDGQPHHGPGALGLRRAYGGTPTSGDETAANNQPDAGSDSFALDEVGQPLPANPLDGVAFLQIRRTDEKGIQPVRSEERKMAAYVTGGLGGWTWIGSGPYARSWQTSLTNPIWIVVNTYLNGLGLLWASDETQQAEFDVAAAITAATVCDTTVAKIIGIGDERQFAFQGIVAEEKPLRDWIQEILGSCLGYYTLAFGKLKLGIRYNSSALEAFTLGNILFNSLQLSSRSSRFNDLTVAFSDEEYGYQQNTVNWKDSDHITSTGLPLKANVNLLGVTSKSQAARISTIKGREELGGITAAEQLSARRVQFRTTVLALNVEPGMVCSMTSAEMPGGIGEFRVTSWRLNPDWSIDVAGETTTDSMYDLTVGEKPADVTPEPLPERIAYDLLPGDVTNVMALEPLNDQLKITVPVRFTPPSPRGSFQSVVAYVRMPSDAPQAVFGGRHGIDWNLIDLDGSYTIQVDVPRPFDADSTATIYLVSASPIYEKNLDLINTPHTASLALPLTAPVGEVTVADVTHLQASWRLTEAGNVEVSVTGECPLDSNFAGCEMFLTIPREDDPEPQHPTAPLQLYPQGWHYGAFSTEQDSRPFTATLIVPAPPKEYLETLSSKIITWVIYALPRTWGGSNRLVLLSDVTNRLPANHTPCVLLTMDLSDYVGGGTTLGQVSNFSLAVTQYTNGEDGDLYALVVGSYTIPAGADLISAYVCEKPLGYAGTPDPLEFVGHLTSPNNTFDSWYRRPKNGCRLFMLITAASQAASVWRPVDTSCPIRYVDIDAWGMPGAPTAYSIVPQNVHVVDGSEYFDLAVNFTPSNSPDYWYMKVGRIWRLNANYDSAPGATYEENGDFGERASFVVRDIKRPAQTEYWTYRFRPVNWQELVNDAAVVYFNVTIPATGGLDLGHAKPGSLAALEVVGGKLQPKVGSGLEITGDTLRPKVGSGLELVGGVLQPKLGGGVQFDGSLKIALNLNADFVVDGNGKLTQYAVDLAKSYNYSGEFTKSGGVLVINAIAVNKLLAGTALFTGQTVFASSSNPASKVVIDSSGCAVYANASNYVSISTAGMTIRGGSVSVTDGVRQVVVDSSGVLIQNGSNYVQATSNGVNIVGGGVTAYLDSSGLHAPIVLASTTVSTPRFWCLGQYELWSGMTKIGWWDATGMSVSGNLDVSNRITCSSLTVNGPILASSVSGVSYASIVDRPYSGYYTYDPSGYLADDKFATWWDGSTLWLVYKKSGNKFRVAMGSY